MDNLQTAIVFSSTTVDNLPSYVADFSMMYWFLGIQIVLLVMIFLKLRK